MYESAALGLLDGGYGASDAITKDGASQMRSRAGTDRAVEEDVARVLGGGGGGRGERACSFLAKQYSSPAAFPLF